MSNAPHILAVDRNQRNLELLTRFLGAAGFELITIHCLNEFDRTLLTAPSIHAALIDISGFDRTIWSYCEPLRDRQIPFLILSPRTSPIIQQESLAQGAHGMLIKPLVVKELIGLLNCLMGEQP
ncbi:response regulator [filamentous cyanobacterium CCP1]|nr:response regulator [filamentous cyanobacterium CCP2]PSB68199.1 response regulator [filamentous cyanobacterium CCP1]